MATIKHEATAEQQQAAKSLQDQHLYCRTYGHNWRPLSEQESATLFNHIKWGTAIGLQCETCEMVRGDIINQYGQVAYRIYRQPDGYSIPQGETPDRALLRLEYIQRRNLTYRTGE